MLPPTAWANPKSPVLQIRIQDSGSGIRCLFDPWIRDPRWGSGMGKSQSGSGFGIRIQDGKPGSYFWELRHHFCGLKYLNFLMRILEPGSGMKNIWIWDLGSGTEKNLDPGSGIQDGKNLDPGSWIRDYHPRWAKIKILLPNLLGFKEPNNNWTLCGKRHFGMRPSHFENLRPH